MPQCEYCWPAAKIGGVVLAGTIVLTMLLATFTLSNWLRFLLVALFLTVTAVSAILILKYLNCVQFYKKLRGP